MKSVLPVLAALNLLTASACPAAVSFDTGDHPTYTATTGVGDEGVGQPISVTNPMPPVVLLGATSAVSWSGRAQCSQLFTVLLQISSRLLIIP